MFDSFDEPFFFFFFANHFIICCVHLSVHNLNDNIVREYFAFSRFFFLLQIYLLFVITGINYYKYTVVVCRASNTKKIKKKKWLERTQRQRQLRQKNGRHIEVHSIYTIEQPIQQC